jgi:hypothetical protein
MQYRAHLATIFALILSTQITLAQGNPHLRTPRLTNKDVVALITAGISSDVIIAKIKASLCEFNTEPAALAELKGQGVPNDVLKAMVEAPAGRPPTEGAAEEKPSTREAEDARVSGELAAAEKVVSAMRRLDNAIAVGVTFQNYSALLIEQKTIVDENLRAVSNAEFRGGVERALLDHQYAMYVWNLAAANNWAYFYTKQEPGRTLITRYGVPIKISIWTQVPVMTGLSHIWLSARGHFNSAENTLRVMKSPPPQPAEPVTTAGDDSGPAGTWDLRFEGKDNKGTAKLTLTEVGGKLGGKLGLQSGEVELSGLTFDAKEGRLTAGFTTTEDGAQALGGLRIVTSGDAMDGRMVLVKSGGTPVSVPFLGLRRH